MGGTRRTSMARCSTTLSNCLPLEMEVSLIMMVAVEVYGAGGLILIMFQLSGY